MLPSLLPVSFFKVLPLPQKFNRFRFHIPGTRASTENFPGEPTEKRPNTSKTIPKIAKKAEK